jgi:predicted phage terminase large subunit-like protein
MESSVQRRSDDELLLWKELEQRSQASQSLASYIDYLGITPAPSTHHRLLIEKLEAITRGDIQRLMVWMPPGSAKSTYASVLFPPYYMGRHATTPILGVSNTTELAERFSRRARNIVASQSYRNVFGFGCKEDTRSAGSWENERGGEFFAAGIGSAIAGRRAGLGLIDDPVKSREEADSERVREKHWDWYLNDFLTRLLPNAPQIVIQTRWHEDDLSGRILEREANRWHVLKLPMEARENDLLGRKYGERLWPEWFTDEMVQTAKQDNRSWNALWQQDPAPDEGDYFKREWFNDYRLPPQPLHYYGASDYAVTEGSGDFTEHGIFGLDYNGDLYLLDWWRGQTTSDKWIEIQCDLIARYSPLIWFGESGPIRKAIEPFLKRRMQERQTPCRLEWLASIVDKVVRARAFQARCAMGNVFLPSSSGWLSDLMNQLMRFPAGKYDDGVDVCSLIGRGLEHARPPQMPKPKVIEPQRMPSRHDHDGLSWMET